MADSKHRQSRTSCVLAGPTDGLMPSRSFLAKASCSLSHVPDSQPELAAHGVVDSEVERGVQDLQHVRDGLDNGEQVAELACEARRCIYMQSSHALVACF